MTTQWFRASDPHFVELPTKETVGGALDKNEGEDDEAQQQQLLWKVTLVSNGRNCNGQTQQIRIGREPRAPIIPSFLDGHGYYKSYNMLSCMYYVL